MPSSPRFDLIDRSGQVRRPTGADLRAELRGAFKRLSARPDPSGLPRGDGTAVLVIPGFGEGDLPLRSLRRWLDALGYHAHGWGIGLNFGPTAGIFDRMLARLDALYAESGRPVVLVGISMGGVFARVLGHARPHAIARIVTIASPFRLPVRSSIERLYMMLEPFHAPLPDWVAAALHTPPPVPTTAFYSRDDGIVPWECCIDEPASGRENIEVDGGHIVMPSNPRTLHHLAHTLAMPPRRPNG